MHAKYSTFEPVYEYKPHKYTVSIPKSKQEPYYVDELVGYKDVVTEEQIVIGYETKQQPVYRYKTIYEPIYDNVNIYDEIKKKCKCQKCNCSKCAHGKTLEDCGCKKCKCDLCADTHQEKYKKYFGNCGFYYSYYCFLNTFQNCCGCLTFILSFIMLLYGILKVENISIVLGTINLMLSVISTIVMCIYYRYYIYRFKINETCCCL